MSYLHYLVDASKLSPNDREKLLKQLDDYSETGSSISSYTDGLYTAFFDESTDPFLLPFPDGTILKKIP